MQPIYFILPLMSYLWAAENCFDEHFAKSFNKGFC